MSQFAIENDRRSQNREHDAAPTGAESTAVQAKRTDAFFPLSARAYVQMREAQHQQKRKLASARLKRTASWGVSDASEGYPFAAEIQQAFGKHSIGDAQSVIGGKAKQATEQMGAEAYASGNRVAFKKQPDLHTAAHEAAHLIQQRGGVQLKSGVGQQGDAYERHADQVADRVVQGKSAESLLDPFGRGQQTQTPALQLKTAPTKDKTAKQSEAHKPFEHAKSAFFQKHREHELKTGETLKGITAEKVQTFVKGSVKSTREYRVLKKEFRRYAKHLAQGNVLKKLESTPEFSVILLENRLIRTSSEKVRAINRIARGGGIDAKTIRLMQRLAMEKSRAVKDAANQVQINYGANSALRLTKQVKTLTAEKNTLRQQLSEVNARVNGNTKQITTLKTTDEGQKHQIHQNALTGMKNAQKNIMQDQQLKQHEKTADEKDNERKEQAARREALMAVRTQIQFYWGSVGRAMNKAAVFEALPKDPKPATFADAMRAFALGALNIVPAIGGVAKLVKGMKTLKNMSQTVSRLEKVGAIGDGASVLDKSIKGTGHLSNGVDKISQSRPAGNVSARQLFDQFHARFGTLVGQQVNSWRSAAEKQVDAQFASDKSRYLRDGSTTLAADVLRGRVFANDGLGQRFVGKDGILDPTLDKYLYESFKSHWKTLADKLRVESGVGTPFYVSENKAIVPIDGQLQSEYDIDETFDPRTLGLDVEQLGELTENQKNDAFQGQVKSSLRELVDYRGKLRDLEIKHKHGMITGDQLRREKVKLFATKKGELHHGKRISDLIEHNGLKRDADKLREKLGADALKALIRRFQ